MNSLDELYDYFIEEGLLVDLVDETYHLYKNDFHLLLSETEENGDYIPHIVSTNIPYLEGKPEVAQELMITAITMNGIEQHTLH